MDQQSKSVSWILRAAWASNIVTKAQSQVENSEIIPLQIVSKLTCKEVILISCAPNLLLSNDWQEDVKANFVLEFSKWEGHKWSEYEVLTMWDIFIKVSQRKPLSYHAYMSVEDEQIRKTSQGFFHCRLANPERQFFGKNTKYKTFDLEFFDGVLPRSPSCINHYHPNNPLFGQNHQSICS